MNDCFTSHGHNMFDISSLVQKSLRRGDTIPSYYAANQMADRYRGYLWKRLLTVSMEDCNDMVTGRVLELRNADMSADSNDYSKISLAVSILIHARKNRDADYFICNYQNSFKRRELTKYVCSPKTSSDCMTKNWHHAFDVRDFLVTAIDERDGENAGYAAYELVTRYPKLFWKTIYSQSVGYNFTNLSNEIKSLEDAGSKHKLDELAAAKAIVLMMKCLSLKDDTPFVCAIIDDGQNLHQFDDVYCDIPDYAYDCHTKIGRMRGKTKRDFIKDEYDALHPRVEGLYDRAGWDNFFFLDRFGWDDPNVQAAPMPDKKTIAMIDSGVEQLSMF